MNTCKTCSKEFKGRPNQKFCSIKCKNSFHNVKNREKESHVIEVNKHLHKNWSTLENLYKIYRSAPISKDILRSFGFNDKYLTHIHTSPVGEKYIMIYDYGYKNHIDNQIQIVQGDL